MRARRGKVANDVPLATLRHQVLFPLRFLPSIPIGTHSMTAVVSLPGYVWPAIHVLGLLLALSSRSRLGPRCAFCTNLLLVASTLVVAGVALFGFASQEPFWALSGCTLGVMAITTVFDRSGHEYDLVLQEIALTE